MAELFDFMIKAGATAPPNKITIKNENNSAVNLTGQKGAKFYMRSVGGSALMISGSPCTVTDSVNGQLQYSFSTGDTSTFDKTQCFGEFHITLTDNTILKVPTEGYQSIYIGDSLK